jgi:RsiW-degrading membrane proteinase PrsW (M82 family)
MDWMKIGWALLLIAFLVVIAPRAMYMLKNSPKGSNKDWMLALVLLGGVALFVLILMKMV